MKERKRETIGRRRKENKKEGSQRAELIVKWISQSTGQMLLWCKIVPNCMLEGLKVISA